MWCRGKQLSASLLKIVPLPGADLQRMATMAVSSRKPAAEAAAAKKIKERKNERGSQEGCTSACLREAAAGEESEETEG
jgi:hypothetical protein